MVMSVAHAQRKLAAGQMSRLVTLAADGSDLRLVYETSEVIEAPNWSPDGKWLVYNGGGGLFRIAASADGAKPERIEIGDVKGANNDHVLAPNGRTIYFSARGHLYAVPFAGGQPRRISNEQPAERPLQHWLHGVSPDETMLAFTGTRRAGVDTTQLSDIYTLPVAGGKEVNLTNSPAFDDGPEYSPDGKWIYFNSELGSTVAGHAQIHRMRPDGTGVERLTNDERVNWFPHVSPDGRVIVYVSFPAGTLGHPADRAVILRRMNPDGTGIADLIAFTGGQGTMNVASWAPDSRRFAFVMYPRAGETPERRARR